ncbi:glycoprotein hormone alpha-2 [Hypanus sabinus]|uniref:glycoprotein hormone alpha-2 n=1 Tax=Hypanus sabinus TaxID=79690 RepID=UPI0028C4D04A|nr:glycoprotein hormone alpha-2 [Hypanus sabinus]
MAVMSGIQLFFLTGLIVGSFAQSPEPAAGCQLYPFNVTIRSDGPSSCRGRHVSHACVGYCESSAFPSKFSVLRASGFRHITTSVSQCCTIGRLEKVRVSLSCGERTEELEIFTARSCRCDMCRQSRY